MSITASERTRLITSAPIGNTLFRLTLPMVFGIVAMMLLGIADAWFISRLGTVPLAAIGFCLPVTFAIISTALGLGMGISSLVSRLLGEGQFATAARLVTDAQLLVLLIALAIVAALMLGMDRLFIALGATAEVLPYIRDYMAVWLVAVPFVLLMQTGNTTLRAAGDPGKSALLSLLLAVINGVLDPLFIFGLGPVPAMGMTGAALATLVAFFATFCGSVYLLAFREKLILPGIPKLPGLLTNWRSLCAIGIPAVFANVMTPLGAAILTAMIARFGTEAVAALGVAARIESFALIVIFALSSTVPMFIGQNLGAGKPDRAREALFKSMRFGLLFQALVYAGLALTALNVAASFSDNMQVQAVIRTYIFIVPLTHGAHGIVILAMVSMNVLHRPKTALLVTVMRLLCLNLPLAFIGGQVGGITGLFLGFACGNLISGLLTYRIVRRVWQTEVANRA